jgi:hypothetical protein
MVADVLNYLVRAGGRVSLQGNKFTWVEPMKLARHWIPLIVCVIRINLPKGYEYASVIPLVSADNLGPLLSASASFIMRTGLSLD